MREISVQESYENTDAHHLGQERIGRRAQRGHRLHAHTMPKVSVEIPEELLNDLDEHVGQDGKFVNRSEAIRASIRKTLDILDDIDHRHGRLTDAEE